MVWHANAYNNEQYILGSSRMRVPCAIWAMRHGTEGHLCMGMSIARTHTHTHDVTERNLSHLIKRNSYDCDDCMQNCMVWHDVTDDHEMPKPTNCVIYACGACLQGSQIELWLPQFRAIAHTLNYSTTPSMANE